MVFAVMLAICLTVSAVSADEGWSFNFSSSDSSNSDGGAFSLENGKLKLQDIEFTIPDGYKENESARKLAAPAEDVDDAKYSVCQFVNDGKEIFVKVFFFDDDGEFNNLTAVDNQVAKKMGDHDGVYESIIKRCKDANVPVVSKLINTMTIPLLSDSLKMVN